MSEETRVVYKELFLYDVDEDRLIRVFDGFLIGRSDCHWNVLGDPSVSRQHCKFHVQSNGVLVEDLNSRNKTLLNGKEIMPGARLLLKAGDEIQVGNRNFVFRAAEGGSGAQPRRVPSRPASQAAAQASDPIAASAAAAEIAEIDDELKLQEPFQLALPSPSVPTSRPKVPPPYPRTSPASPAFPAAPPGAQTRAGNGSRGGMRSFLKNDIAGFLFFFRWPLSTWISLSMGLVAAGALIGPNLRMAWSVDGLPATSKDLALALLPAVAGSYVITLFAHFLIVRHWIQKRLVRAGFSLACSAAFAGLLLVFSGFTSYRPMADTNNVVTWCSARFDREPCQRQITEHPECLDALPPLLRQQILAAVGSPGELHGMRAPASDSAHP